MKLKLEISPDLAALMQAEIAAGKKACREIAAATALSQDCRRLIDPDLAEGLRGQASFSCCSSRTSSK